VAHDVVSERLEWLVGKLFVGQFEFLQADDVGLAFSQPVDRELESSTKSVDIPGRNPHRLPRRQRARSSIGFGPGLFDANLTWR